MKTFSNNAILAAHRHSSHHRREINRSTQCACFFCCSIFAPSEIVDWVDWPENTADGMDDDIADEFTDENGVTALCPRCGVDAVIGSDAGYPLTNLFLKRMRQHWFWPETERESRNITPQMRQELNTNAAQFASQDDDVFGRIATRYDRLCDLFSFGIHRLWKRKVAARIAAEEWTSLLDGATGTGDIILRVLRHYPMRQSNIIASDLSPQMLAIAEKRLAEFKQQLQLQILNAEHMPTIATASVDAYSISLGLKICNRERVLREALRVLKPNGRLIILESSHIQWNWLNRLYLFYMSLCMPILGWIATGGDASAYQYLLRGIREFPNAEELAVELQALGFIDVQFERLSLGIVAIHVARKPA